MEIKQLIQRLNELYHQSKERTLTEAELTERNGLRKEYLGLIKNQVKDSLDRIEIIDPELSGEVEEKEHCCSGNCSCGSECGCKHED